MTDRYIKRTQCRNRYCRVELKDSERGHCAVCKAIIAKTFEIAQRQIQKETNNVKHKFRDRKAIHD